MILFACPVLAPGSIGTRLLHPLLPLLSAREGFAQMRGREVGLRLEQGQRRRHRQGNSQEAKGVVVRVDDVLVQGLDISPS